MQGLPGVDLGGLARVPPEAPPAALALALVEALMGFKPAYGVCPGCGWVRACRADGTLGTHLFTNKRGQHPGHSCPGIGQKPVKYVPRPEATSTVNPQRQGG